MSIREIFWPRLEKPSVSQQDADKQELTQDRALIRNGQWDHESVTALEEARRLYDAEDNRRKTADTKAGIYLAVVSTLSPILASLITTPWEDDTSMALRVISTLLLLPAIGYLLASGWWAFQTLKVSASSRVDIKDLVKYWNRKNPKAYLVRGHLLSVRLNRYAVNQKVSCIKMTHAFLLRAFIMFTLLLFFQAAGAPISSLFQEEPKPIQINLIDNLTSNPGSQSCIIQIPLKPAPNCDQTDKQDIQN